MEVLKRGFEIYLNLSNEWETNIDSIIYLTLNYVFLSAKIT